MIQYRNTINSEHRTYNLCHTVYYNLILRISIQTHNWFSHSVHAHTKHTPTVRVLHSFSLKSPINDTFTTSIPRPIMKIFRSSIETVLLRNLTHRSSQTYEKIFDTTTSIGHWHLEYFPSTYLSLWFTRFPQFTNQVGVLYFIWTESYIRYHMHP